MNSAKQNILSINSGSSSIKFALYRMGTPLTLLLSGEVEHSTNTGDATVDFTSNITNQTSNVHLASGMDKPVTDQLIDLLEKQAGSETIAAIGHRIVYGMKHAEPELITPELIYELKAISVRDPEHLPEEIKLIEAFRKHFPSLIQVACFDTSFHVCMPDVAKRLAIPRRYAAMGIQRYGFHGLSYAYLMEELKRIAPQEATGKVILAHLGSGASLAAVKNGKSMDTSMGFTPAAGLPMCTRTGDLDPGVTWFLMQQEKLNPEQLNHLINHESGLLGISETSSDIRELLKHKDTDVRAAEAIDFFCYQTQKWIGSFAVVLEGIDILVFSGGIGLNAPEIRARICKKLRFLGIELDEKSNLNNEAVISIPGAPVTVRVIRTNEELMIAKSVCRVLNYSTKN